jgi:transcription elongation factor Elf1
MELIGMALRFKCLHCGNEILVQYLKIGEIALCRNCDRENEVPATAEKVDPVYEIHHDGDSDSIPGKGISSVSKESLENINALEAYSLESPSNATIILSWITVALLSVLILSNLMQYLLLLDMISGKTANLYSRALANDSRQILLSLLYLAAGMASSIAYFIWFYRAHKNLRRANVPGLKHASCWTVWGYFVPILNFFRPYQMMAESWKGSATMSGKYNYDELMALSTSAKIKWWWALVFIAIPINVTGGIIRDSADNIQDLMTATRLSILGQVIYIIDFILLIYLIKEITRHQSNARKIALIKSTA